MWEKIAEVVAVYWGLLTPFVVINQYEKAVILRLGLYLRTLGPGLHWKWPGYDAVLTVEAVQTTMRIQPQTLTTKDGISVTTSGVLQYKIENPEPYLLGVLEGQDAINDITMAEIKRVIADNDWKNLNNHDIETKVIKKVRNQVGKHGVEAIKFGFADLGRIRTIRLIGSVSDVEY